MRPSGIAAPTNAAGLIGREADHARVIAAVEAGERLVTLLGPPGIGKTSLALSVLEDLARGFTDGRAWFLDLATARTEADLCFAILSRRRTGPDEAVGAATPANVAAALDDEGRALLVLDNFEQIAFAAPLLARLLGAAPRVAMIVTSRERLAVAGEHVIELQPLGCPAPGASSDELARSCAVQLFRARATDAGALASDDLEAIGAVVRRLDGIPLAIEIAAARTRLLSPSELSERLGRGEDVLAGVVRRSHDRHRTLEDAIAWSWSLLAEDERVALASLAVFPTSFTLASAEVIVAAALSAPPGAALPAAGAPRAAPIDLVAAVREKSLVHPTDDGRLALYVSIREFAAKRLVELGRAEVVSRAHASMLHELARRFNVSVLVGDPSPGVEIKAAARRERVDVVTARGFAAASPPARDTAAMSAELTAAEAFLAAVPAEVSERRCALLLVASDLPARERCLLILARQSALHHLGRIDEAIEASAVVAAVPGAPRGMVAFALANAGVLHRARGDVHAAWTEHERARAIVEDDPSLQRLAGLNTACMGRLKCDLGDVEAARTLNARAIELCDRLGDRWLSALGLANLAQLEQEQGSFERAEDLLARALERFRDTGEHQYEAIYAAMRGGLYFEWGKLDQARDAYAEGDAVLDELQRPASRVVIHGGRAALEALSSRPALAGIHLDLARRGAARAPTAVSKLFVALTEATVEVVRLGAASADARRRWLAEIVGGASAEATLVRTNIDLRFMARILSKALTIHGVPAATAVLRVDADALSFAVDDKPRVDLGRRGALRRILAALCAEQLAHPGRALSAEELTARGWPNERMLAEAASTRVRVAIATLRKLGLREVLATRDDGYLIDPKARVERD
jgi:predicted ATPase